MPTTPKQKLDRLADDILRALDKLEEDSQDPRVAVVRGHVLALAQLLGAHGPELQERATAELEEARNHEITEQRRQHTTPPQGNVVRGFRRTTAPAPPQEALVGKRPGLYTERRAARQQAGVTLQQIRQTTGMSLATVRMYEVRPQSVRPDKRVELDHIYAQFRTK